MSDTNAIIEQILSSTKLFLAAVKIIVELKFEEAIAEVKLMKYQECWDCKNYITVYDEKDGVYDLPCRSCSCEEV